MTHHIGLFGDSIFDNQSYTAGEPDVVTHLRRLLPALWTATLYAVDGHTTWDIEDQLSGISADVSHVVLSIGGNDALQESDLLDRPVSSTAEALDLIGERVRQFEARYRSVVGSFQALGRPLVVCTIYDGKLDPPVMAARARLAVALFNDVILRVAFENELSVIELRHVCHEDADYANPIEPSGRGGEKIAAVITDALGIADNGAKMSRVTGELRRP